MANSALFTNNATSTLASGITNVATSLTVATGAGSLFPTLSGGDYFYCTLANSGGAVEIVKVTARTTDTFTIVRAQDNTAAQAWNLGDKVELRLTNASLQDLVKTNTQTLTNKTILANGSNTVEATSAPATSQLGYRNRAINGAMLVAQWGTSATVTAGTGVPTASIGYPCVDRFFVYSTGANVTAAQVNGANATSKLLQITGAASVTAVGVGHRIEAKNSYDLAGGTIAFSIDLANSLLTTVTWTAYYANSADTFGTIGTPTKTQIATGSFTVNNTLTRYSTTFSAPAAAVTGIEIILTVGAQTSGTWQIGRWQVEPGAVTPFENIPHDKVLSSCQRYYETINNTTPAAAFSTTLVMGMVSFKVTKRAVPTIGVPTLGTFIAGGSSASITAFAAGASSVDNFEIDLTSAGLTAGQGGNWRSQTVTAAAEIP